MDQTLAAERTAAEAALAGWRRMLAKAVHPREGEVAPSAVQERLKSLDAAWTRFDQAHSRYLNILNTVHGQCKMCDNLSMQVIHIRLLAGCPKMPVTEWEAEQASWEASCIRYHKYL